MLRYQSTQQVNGNKKSLRKKGETLRVVLTSEWISPQQDNLFLPNAASSYVKIIVTVYSTVFLQREVETLWPLLKICVCGVFLLNRIISCPCCSRKNQTKCWTSLRFRVFRNYLFDHEQADFLTCAVTNTILQSNFFHIDLRNVLFKGITFQIYYYFLIVVESHTQEYFQIKTKWDAATFDEMKESPISILHQKNAD